MDSRNGETLGEYVKRIRLEKDLTVDAVSIASGKNGDGKPNISPAYVNKIENENPNVSAPKLDSLAKGLGVPRFEIYAIAYGLEFDFKVIPFERFSKIAERYSGLSKRTQESLEPFLAALESSIEQFEKTQHAENITKENIVVLSADKIKEMRGKKPIKGGNK